MTLPTKCPICNNQAEWMYWTGPLGIEEEHIDCPDCGYYYEFVYGYYIKCVKGEEFTWSYSTKHSDPIFKRIKRATFMARRNRKKFKKAYKTKNI